MKNLLTVFCSFIVALATAKEAPQPISLGDFKLLGDLSGGRAVFTLDTTAHVENSRGGTLTLMRGPIALIDVPSNQKWRIRTQDGQFVLYFERAGTFPLQIKFEANVQQTNGWNQVEFSVAPSVLQPIRLKALAADAQVQFIGTAPPEYHNGEFDGFLAGDGSVNFRWKGAPKETEGKLFYSAEMLSQVTVSPGLLRQVALLNFKVMQGELNQIALLLRGPGEITRIQGDKVLAWKIEPVANSNDRRLIVQLNQPQKEQFDLQIQTQTALGAFPQTADVLQINPESATRFAGYFRVANEGAVRLEVTQASGLSQISPEQFPETDLTKAMLRPSGNQRFAYRFSGADFAMRIAADQILPELAVSELVSYHLAENELTIDAEFELDIREAPLRELSLSVPAGYAVAQLNAVGLSDYFQPDPGNREQAELRLVFGQPISGRQLVQLRLERNKPLGQPTWNLPRIEIPKAKSVRGHIATAVAAGFRLAAERTSGLTEIATAFFPRKIVGIQSAFRISEPGWQALLRVERLSQTVQADVLHLFSIGEGIAYGSSVLNYAISGAPVSVFKVELSDEYFNIEFTGKDVRNWQKVLGGYQVQLHTPVSGAYTLLATYERPFKSQGETLTFTGARPLDVQSEQGHTLIISTYQFQVKPIDISPGLLPLEPGEVPSEYRLLFDAPILAAYRYVARPFNLRLALSPLTQGDSLSLVVDRASLTTRISKEGQVLTDARYFVKNRGNPHLRLTLPSGARLWSVTVNGAPVVPVADANSNLVPLPHGADPNAVLTVDFKLASVSTNVKRVEIAAPIVNAPVMLAEWRLNPDVGQRLFYRRGSLTPANGESDDSGFAQIARAFSRGELMRSASLLSVSLAFVVLAVVGLRWAAGAAFKLSSRHIAGLALGALALVIACLILNQFASQLTNIQKDLARDLTFLAPVQQAGSALNLEVLNEEDRPSFVREFGAGWPVLFAVPALAFVTIFKSRTSKNAVVAFAWLMAAWAALRLTNGAMWFLVVICAFLLSHVILPLLLHSWRAPAHKPGLPVSAASAGSASVGLVLLLGASLFWNACQALAASPEILIVQPTPRADSTLQEIRVEERFGYAVAKIHWEAEKGQTLPLLSEPGVLTGIVYPLDSLKLERVLCAIVQERASTPNSSWRHQMVAKKSGKFDLELRYELPVIQCGDQTGFFLPVPPGLINRLKLTIENRDVDVISSQAVAVRTESISSNTVADLVLSPAAGAWIGWKPRSRDVKHEKPVFYAELSGLYIPSAGVIEAEHLVSLRLAQGELSELYFDVPQGVTVTDVTDPGHAQAAESAAKPGPDSIISLWRFDPDARKLRVSFTSAQTRPFALLIRSQIATGPLPVEQTLGTLTVQNAADQVGLLGVATGNEVQLDSATPDLLSSINLEDFPPELLARLQPQIPGLTVRRAFRYSRPGGKLSVHASAVEPDIRVENQETVSLGEDRTLLAVNSTVGITRAGIFRLSFNLPFGFDVESISGPALSHWTQARSDTNQVITLHLNGKTQGQQQFAISLVGPGVKATNGWVAPQLVLREANKQSGTVLLVPEQGLRLQVASADGLTQLDPQKSGIKQKGVLAFRVLQNPRRLVLNLEQVTAWIQVNSLQHARVSEAQVDVMANLQYQIENTGLKSFRVLVPTNAESVHFEGEQVSDFLPIVGAMTNGLQAWEIRLQRRVIGSFLLKLTYQAPVPEKTTQWLFRGVLAGDVNLQRGFVTVESVGRLQMHIDSLPQSLQSAEWQSIPRALQQGFASSAANFSYRLVEPDFVLPLQLERYQAAQLLPGRISNVSFNSVVSDDGVMLTQVKLDMVPGSKRLLRLTLPQNAQFWFAFVSENGVWPWREQNQILIPLDQQSVGNQTIPVELFYTCKIGEAKRHSLDLELPAPQFDLPLENITWRVSLSDKWELKKWSGSLQLQQDELVSQNARLDVQGYLQNENLQQQQRTKQAESFLAAANSALAQGDPQQARKSFQAAFGLSTHDAAFNEDARVQLHNIKLQEALVALNVRQAVSSGDNGALGGKLRELRDRKVANYTQQDAKDIIERNSSDENAAFMKLAERLIQQQDAAVTTPAALHATIPDQNRILTFKRAVLIDPWASLNIRVKIAAVTAANWLVRFSILAISFSLLALLIWVASHSSRTTPETPA